MATFNTYQGPFTTETTVTISDGETEVVTGSGTVAELQVDGAGNVTGTVTETGSATVVINGSETEVESLDASGAVSGTLASLYKFEVIPGTTVNSTLVSFSFSTVNGNTVLQFSDQITVQGLNVEPGVTVNVSGYLDGTLTAVEQSLFTTGPDIVNFNILTAGQQAAIASGADIYHGLGGSDVVTFPNEANYNESVAKH